MIDIATIKQRPIEFEAWDTLKKCMIKGNDIVLYGAINEINPLEKYLLRQFTGLYDRNNKKLFEYDIIKYAFDWDFGPGDQGGIQKLNYSDRIFKKPTKKSPGFYYGVVQWENNDNQFAHFVISPGRMNLMPTQFLIEKAGNIFENPEITNFKKWPDDHI